MLALHCETGSSVAACNNAGNLPVSASPSHPLSVPTTTSTIASTLSSSKGLSATVDAVPSTAVTSLTSSPTPSNNITQTSEDSMSGHLIAVAVSVVIAVVVLVVVLITVVTVHHLRSADKSPRSPNSRSQVSPRIQSTRQLLILYSWGTSEHNQQRIMQCLVSQLTYGTDLVYSAKSEVRGNIPQWVEKQISDSDKVLIVCNKQFSREWQSPGSTHTEGAIVNALKAIITGHINSGTMDKICCKTALVFLKEKHKELVPSGILHSFKQYMLYEQDSDKQNELLRFISDTPLFYFCPQDEEEIKVMV